MPITSYKKPTKEEFAQLVEAAAGNLSIVARSLKVARSTIAEWVKTDPEFRQSVKDERMKLFDEALVTARLLAKGIPAYEDVLDKDGNPVLDKFGNRQRRIAGWIERPSETMLKYFLGRYDDEEPGEELSDRLNHGVSIKAWIQKMNEEGE